MPIYAKAFTGKDIINGLAVVSPTDMPSSGGSVIQSYDAVQRTQHLASGDSLLQFQRLDAAYKHHGGAGGSGYWEH